MADATHTSGTETNGATVNRIPADAPAGDTGKAKDPNATLFARMASGSKPRSQLKKAIGTVTHTVTLTGVPLSRNRKGIDALAAAGGKVSAKDDLEGFDSANYSSVLSGEDMAEHIADLRKK